MPEGRKVYVWDRVVRLSHILLILGVVNAYLTYHYDRMDLHMLNGYAMLAVLAMRIVWGFVGSPHARFSGFLRPPRTVVEYLTTWKNQKVPLGHNPLGGYAVLGLLSVLVLQATTGLFTTDDIMVEGPLYSAVSSSVANTLTFMHKNAFWFVLLPMIALHVLAVAVYWRFKKANLVKPMLTGYKDAT